MRKGLTQFGWFFQCWAVQKLVNLADLVKNFQTSIRGHEEDLGLHQVAQAQRGDPAFGIPQNVFCELQNVYWHITEGFCSVRRAFSCFLVGYMPISQIAGIALSFEGSQCPQSFWLYHTVFRFQQPLGPTWLAYCVFEHRPMVWRVSFLVIEILYST